MGVVGLVLAGILLLLLSLAAIFFATPLFQSVLQSEVLPRVSERIGREVTVERARGNLLTLNFRFRGIRVEGSGETPIVVIDELQARPKLWPMIRSLGDTVALSSLRIDGMEANLIRRPDGTFDLPTLPEVPPEERRTYVVDRAVVEGAEVNYIDQAEQTSVTLSDLHLAASLGEDEAVLRGLGANVAEGRLFATARAQLGEEVGDWEATVDLAEVDLGALPPVANSLQGILDAEGSFSGTGTEREQILSSLTGNARVEIDDMRWLNTTFLQDLATEIGEFIHFPKGAAPDYEDSLDFGSPIVAEFEVDEGWVNITEPPDLRAAFGEAEVRGRVSLQKELDLIVDLGLAPEFLSKMTAGTVEPDEPVPVTLEVKGTTDNPDMNLVDTGDLSDLDPGLIDRIRNWIRDRFGRRD